MQPASAAGEEGAKIQLSVRDVTERRLVKERERDRQRWIGSDDWTIGRAVLIIVYGTRARAQGDRYLRPTLARGRV